MHSRKLKWASPLFIIFLALASVFGATSAIIGSQRVTETPEMEKADAASWNERLIYVGFQGKTSSSGSWGLTMMDIDTDNDCGTVDIILEDGAQFTFEYKRNHYGGNDWANNKTIKQQPSGNCFTGGSGSDITYSGTKKRFHIKVDNLWNSSGDVYITEAPYTVSFDKQGHGTATPSSQSVHPGSKVTNPGNLSEGSYTFGGWYKEAACTTAWNFASDTVTGDTTIYAKWTWPRTIYYISDVTSGDDDTGNYIYSWTGGIKSFGGWPGATVVSSSRTVSVVMNFRGSYHKIYCITVNDDNFKFSNYNQSYQTSDLTTNNNYAYRWETGGATSDADEGAALYVIDQIEQARNAVPESAKYKQYSICGIGSGTASTLVKAYDDLNSTAKGYVDTSFTYTYTGDGSGQENVYFSAIISQLRKIASGTYSAYRGFIGVQLFGEDNNVTTIIIVVASSVALLSVTALSILVIKKRKHKEQE